jgi:predicted nucleic acid-binding protein
MIAADTNVVSEIMRPNASGAVVDWFDGFDYGVIAVTAPGLAELWFGIDKLAPGKKRSLLEQSLMRALSLHFAPEILVFDAESARVFGRIGAHRRSIGRPIHTIDAMIAAICIANGATLATRNVADFADLDLKLINPFQPA